MAKIRSIHYYEDGDLLITVQNTVFRLHKIILSIASKVFRDMFTCANQSSNDDLPNIQLDEPSVKSFENLVSFIYPKDLSFITWDFIEELSRLGDKYEVNIVLQSVEIFLELHFDENPLFSIILSDRYGFKKVYKESSKLILNDLPYYKSLIEFSKISVDTRTLLLDEFLNYYLLWSKFFVILKSTDSRHCNQQHCFFKYLDIFNISIHLSQQQIYSYKQFNDFLNQSISFICCKTHNEIMVNLHNYFIKFESLEWEKNNDYAKKYSYIKMN